MTTRSPREGEIEGKDYFFVTKEEFESILRKEAEKIPLEIESERLISDAILSFLKYYFKYSNQLIFP